MITIQEVLWLAIDAAGTQGLNTTQMQKGLFLIGKRGHKLPSYEFDPGSYGPICHVTMSHDLEQLLEQDQVWERGKNSIMSPTQHFITLQGHRHAPWSKTEPKQASYLRRAIEWVQTIDHFAMINSVAAEYPEYGKYWLNEIAVRNS